MKTLFAALLLSAVSFGQMSQMAQNRECSHAIKALKKDQTPQNQETVNRACEGVSKGQKFVTAPPVSLKPVAVARPSAPPTAADALEAQYGACAKHFIPSDKCTPEIYEQLKAKDNAPLDPNTEVALRAVRKHQGLMKNPDSIQVHTAYVTETGNVCLEVAGQNGFGGMTVDQLVMMKNGGWAPSAKGFKNNFLAGADNPSPWPGWCTVGALDKRFLAGTDVTDAVNEALKSGRTN